MKKIFTFLLLFALVSVPTGFVHAEYVLPYPSYMPGNKLYSVSRVLDVLNGWWHIGTIGQVKYHMQLSDKYLVEAKTLFEYKQYVLALEALARSDKHIAQVPRYIERAKAENKDIFQFESLFSAERSVHTQTLLTLQTVLPKIFEWTPEKAPASTLRIFDVLSNSIQLRTSFTL